MLIEYYVDRNDDGSTKPVCSASPSSNNNECRHECSHDKNREREDHYQHDDSDDKQHEYPMKLQNSDVHANLGGKLGHLSTNVQCELKQLIHVREDIFPDVPSRTNAADHDVDVDVDNNEPIKQHPYRVHPLKRAHLKKEIRKLSIC